MKYIALSMLTSLGLLSAAAAGPLVMHPTPPPTAVTPSMLFQDTEFFFDIYGSFYDRTERHDECSCEPRHRGDGYGGGFSVGHHFSPYFGARVDVNFTSIHDTPTQIGADLIVRYPIESCGLAPYLLAGGGVDTAEGNPGFVRLGGGLEWRLTPSFGIFGEGSYAWIFDDDRNDALTVKLGVRFIH